MIWTVLFLLIADMSSDIFSRPVDVSKYNCIYAGAQKNVSMAGVNIVIVKDEALNKVSRPDSHNAGLHDPCEKRFHVQYASGCTHLLCHEEFGMGEEKRRSRGYGSACKERADMLYTEIERNKLFRGTAKAEDRSYMNICFVMNDEYKELEADFLQFATERGMVGIKGHRSVGGFRASCYNAQTIEGVQALIQSMKDFEAQH